MQIIYQRNVRQLMNMVSIAVVATPLLRASAAGALGYAIARQHSLAANANTFFVPIKISDFCVKQHKLHILLLEVRKMTANESIMKKNFTKGNPQVKGLNYTETSEPLEQLNTDNNDSNTLNNSKSIKNAKKPYTYRYLSLS